LILTILMLACGLSLNLVANALASPLPQVSTAEFIESPVRLDSKIQLATAEEQAATTRTPKRSKRPKAGWIKPVDIVARLNVLESIGVTQQWSEQTMQLVQRLLKEKQISSFASGMLLDQFSVKLMELDQIVAIVSQRFPNLPEALRLTSELRRLKYDITKRLVIWKALHRLGPKEQTTDARFI